MPDVDFDAAYGARPPWDIGRPQPALLEVATAGGLAGSVLDVGCGTGEHALLAASLGLEAMGVDLAPRAIERAREKAAERGLAARFLVADALDLGSLGAFDTVIDAGLFHVFDDLERSRYVESLAAAVRPGGRLLVLCFSDAGLELAGGPRPIAPSELREAFSGPWEVESIAETAFETVGLPFLSFPALLASLRRA